MIDFLGHDTIRAAYDASIMAVEDAQRLSNEVRTKALQTSGLLTTLFVGILAAFCAITIPLVRGVLLVVALVIGLSLYALLHFIILRKENATRGNVQSLLLGEGMIETMKKIDKKKRTAFLLASQLKGKEKSVIELNSQTGRMQKRYEQIVWGMLISLSFIFGFVIAVTFIVPVVQCA